MKLNGNPDILLILSLCCFILWFLGYWYAPVLITGISKESDI